ncbi:MAG: HAD family hydrolase [Actinomycetota bacterium]
MTPRPFDALIVDFGGVLTTPLQDAMVRFASDAGIELQDFVRVALGVYSGGDDDLVVGFETGRIPEDDFARAFAARIKEQTGRDVDPEGLVDRIFSGLELEEEMLTVVGAARTAGLKTALLSNSWGTRLYPRPRIDALFDTVLISGEVGLRKPDPAIFELALERVGVPGPRSVFVDDHPGHLAAAGELGMTTVLHRTPAATIAELEDLLGIALS